MSMGWGKGQGFVPYAGLEQQLAVPTSSSMYTQMLADQARLAGHRPELLRNAARPCEYCGGPFVPSARSCPGCGAPMAGRR